MNTRQDPDDYAYINITLLAVGVFDSWVVSLDPDTLHKLCFAIVSHVQGIETE